MPKNNPTQASKESEEKSLVPADIASLPLDLKQQQEQLEKCEKIIHEKTDPFLDVVINLQTIKQGKLYECRLNAEGKCLYCGFEDYMEKEFGFRRAYFSRLNKAYRTYQQVMKDMTKEAKEEIPVYPALYLALSDIDSSKRQDALTAVLNDKKNDIKGSDILKWGEENKALRKKKTLPSAQEQTVKIFMGLAKKLAGTEGNVVSATSEERENLTLWLNQIIAKIDSDKATE